MEAKLEEYIKGEETYLCKIESLQEKISTMDRQLEKDTQHQIDIQQFFKDYDATQIT